MGECVRGYMEVARHAVDDDITLKAATVLLLEGLLRVGHDLLHVDNTLGAQVW